MMKINRENYETFFIDYLDGRLPVDEIDQWLDFLRENPDLAAELKELESLPVQPEELPNLDWSYLKKEMPDGIMPFEAECIRYIEQEMKPEEAHNFIRFVESQPDKLKELNRFKATKLKPDETLVFGSLRLLKKQIIPFQPTWWAAAALIVLALSFWFLRPGSQSNYQSSPTAQAIISLPSENDKPEIVLPLSHYQTLQSSVSDRKPEKNIQKEKPAEKMLDGIELRQNEAVALLTSRPVELLAVQSTPVQLESPLAVSPLETKDYSLYRTIPQLLAQEIQSIDPKKEANQLTHGFLGMIRRWSNDRFDYENDAKGKVTKIEFNSKLLAFSVPLGEE